jgi:hypothetical protein
LADVRVVLGWEVADVVVVMEEWEVVLGMFTTVIKLLGGARH